MVMLRLRFLAALMLSQLAMAADGRIPGTILRRNSQSTSAKARIR